MSKRIAILQSNYIPWKGYFDIIGMVDEFIIYDEVQYTKNDWRNRNRIKSIQGIQWITIPVYQKNLQQKISETKVSDYRWREKHWNTLKTNYAKAPYFARYSSILENFYGSFNSFFLSDINVALIRIICDLLNIKTRITNSTEYVLVGDPTEKLINLCIQLKATHYLSGPAANDYLNQKLFAAAGIEIEWMNYQNYPSYPQIYPPFEHGVSILDLLFHTGQEAPNFMKFTKPWR